MATEALPPAPIANVETEAALLGGLMIENKLIDVVADRVSIEDFSEPLHGRIFAAIVKEHSLGRIVSPVTLRSYFADDQSMLELGGAGYLAQLTGTGAAVIGVKDFADQVVELARRRRFNAKLHEIVASSSDYEKPFAEMVAEAENAIVDAARDFDDGIIEMTFADAAKAALEPDTRDRGVTSGIEGLDKALGPIRAQEVIILAGRPGMGKSTLARSYALGAAKQGHGVLFFTHEMSRDQVVQAMLSDLSYDDETGKGIPHNLIVDDLLNQTQRRELARLALEFEGLPLVIVDGSMNTTKLDSIIRRWKRRFAARGVALKLVVDDYLQLLNPPQRERDLYTAVTKVSQALKATMKAHEVGGLILAQLSREVEKREDKRPHLSDLRDSGSIEQDADGVCFLYRAEYYLRLAEPPESTDPKKATKRLEWEQALEIVDGRIDFIVAKRRGRRTGLGSGQWLGPYQAVRS